MPLFSNKGTGAFEPPKDPRDFKREHFFGAKLGRRVLKEFDHSVIYPAHDQKQTMGCTYFSKMRLTAIKFFLMTGKKLSVGDERIFTLWDDGCADGFGDKRRGAFIYDPLKFMHKKERGQVFLDEDGNEVKIWVEDYFDLDDETEAGFWEEVYFGGGVLTGTSSRIGLQLPPAKYRPYIPKSEKKAVNDGHAFPVTGKGYKWKEFISRVWKNFTDLNAKVHANSYGEQWGDEGRFYTKNSQSDRLFRSYGYTIGFEYLNAAEKAPVAPEPKPKLFKDVTEDSWAFPYIKEAVEDGLFEGYEDGTFRPNQPITRAEICAVLSRLKDGR